MLPDWVQTPEGFESLLGIAAGRLREAGHSVVLVVDGIDEAETPADGLPFGLPSLLPDGAYVVGTHRTGWSPVRPDSPSKTMLISREDQRNRYDILAFLAKAATEDVMAAHLAEAGVDPAEFISLLAERCDGVWIYLRYVLQELRIGLRQPGKISDLPSGLREYYANQIRLWQQDPAWDSGLLPLVATLGVAEEALPAAALARLAGIADRVAVRHWCDYTFRPLLTTTRATTGRTLLRYEIYHASFRDALRALYDDGPAGPDEDHSSNLLALADELRQATLTAHSRISDTYLDSFGGIHEGLPRLAEDPGVACLDDGYPLRHLARHLQHAGRTAELHGLLAVEHAVSRDRAINVWFAAHDHGDCIVSYLGDLTRARSESAAATNQVLARHQRAAPLGMELRYALMAASIVSRTASISAGLLKQLIRTGVWSPGRGIDHARRLADPDSRLDALLTVYEHVNAEQQPMVVAQALAAVTAITDDNARASALASLAPLMPTEQLADALAAARAITDDSHQAEALASLAPHLPTEQLADALAAARAITDDSHQAEALAGLAPHLPTEQLADALAAATVITDDYARAEALAGIAPHLPVDEQPAVMSRALAAATAITDDYSRAEALAGIAPHLPVDEQPAVMSRALAAATAITDDYSRAEALAGMAPHLPTEQLADALAAATAITDDYSRAEALAASRPTCP